MGRKIEVEDPAIVKERNESLMWWKRVKIVAVHLGADKVVRIVKVRLSLMILGKTDTITIIGIVFSRFISFIFRLYCIYEILSAYVKSCSVQFSHFISFMIQIYCVYEKLLTYVKSCSIHFSFISFMFQLYYVCEKSLAYVM